MSWHAITVEDELNLIAAYKKGDRESGSARATMPLEGGRVTRRATAETLSLPFPPAAPTSRTRTIEERPIGWPTGAASPTPWPEHVERTKAWLRARYPSWYGPAKQGGRRPKTKELPPLCSRCGEGRATKDAATCQWRWCKDCLKNFPRATAAPRRTR